MNETALPAALTSKNFSTIQVPAAVQGRPSRGLMSICNIKTDYVYTNEKYIILRLVQFNLLIIFVYFNNSTEIDVALQEINDIIVRIKLKCLDLKIIFCSDFNATVADTNGLANADILNFTPFFDYRTSNDKIMNARDKQMLNFFRKSSIHTFEWKDSCGCPSQFHFFRRHGQFCY